MDGVDLGAERFVSRAPVRTIVVGALAACVGVAAIVAAKLARSGEVGPAVIVVAFAGLALWGLWRAADRGRTTVRVFERGVRISPAWRAGAGPLGAIEWLRVSRVATRRVSPGGDHRALTPEEARGAAMRDGIALFDTDGGMMRIPGHLLRSSPEVCEEILRRAFENAERLRAPTSPSS